MDSIKKIIKRDGRMVNYDVNKIANAIFKAAQVLGGKDKEMAMYLARQTELYLLEICHNQVPTVEQIQDAVEKVLIENGHARTAKEYILYRAERTRVRDLSLIHIYAEQLEQPEFGIIDSGGAVLLAFFPRDRRLDNKACRSVTNDVIFK